MLSAYPEKSYTILIIINSPSLIQIMPSCLSSKTNVILHEFLFAMEEVALLNVVQWSVLQIRRGKKDNLGIIFLVIPLKCML